MKKIISLFLICIMMSALCACGEKQPDPTEPVTEEATQQISDGNAADEKITDGDATTQEPASYEFVTKAPVQVTEPTIPVLEDYTFTAEKTENTKNFVFAGETAPTQTCNRIVLTNEDGATEFAVSFAEDGSALTVYSLEPGDKKFNTLAEFDEQGRLVSIKNGSGSYSVYTYTDNTCVLKAYTAEDELQDMRTYYYNANEQTERVERGDEDGVYEIYYYSYTEDGKPASLRVENQTGYVFYQYTYNENGDVDRIRIEQNNEFYCWQIYTYDENGKKDSYLYRKNENPEESHPYDMDILYYNQYDAQGTYIGTAEVDTATNEVYLTVAYDFITTDYPHYAKFINDYYATN